MAESTLPEKQLGFYPEQNSAEPGRQIGISGFLWYLCDRWRMQFEKATGFCQSVNRLEKQYNSLTANQLDDAASSLRNQLRSKTTDKEVAAKVFALVREQARRVLELRPFDVQIAGGWVMLNGQVAEMSTGEGKTLTATLPASIAAFATIPVHIITANDYLAKRDAEAMTPLYQALGITVGAIQPEMSGRQRKEIYSRDVVYCSNKELVFDYLKDRLLFSKKKPADTNLSLQSFLGNSAFIQNLRLQGLHFAIVDEADCLFIDDARTPLILSKTGECGIPGEMYTKILSLAQNLQESRDFTIDKSKKTIDFKAMGTKSLDSFIAVDRALAPYQPHIEFLFSKALTALYLFENGREYIVDNGKVAIIGEQTGRILHGRSWEMGLQQFIEAKESCKITGQPETLIKTNYQKFFNRYHHLAGMTGTAKEVRRELWDMYRLNVISIPTNIPAKARDLGYHLYATEKEKNKAILTKVKNLHKENRPVLVGTSSVTSSETLATLFNENNLPFNLLNARQDQREAEIIARAGSPAQITIATNMAGRGTDIVLHGEVAGIGGLHVLATDCANPQRIDRQLFGRCGRQGDPGSTEALFSLEDPLFTANTIGLTAGVIRFCMHRFKVSNSVLSRILIRMVQANKERRDSAFRRQLFEQDLQREKSLSFSRYGE